VSATWKLYNFWHSIQFGVYAPCVALSSRNDEKECLSSTHALGGVTSRVTWRLIELLMGGSRVGNTTGAETIRVTKQHLQTRNTWGLGSLDGGEWSAVTSGLLHPLPSRLRYSDWSSGSAGDFARSEPEILHGIFCWTCLFIYLFNEFGGP